MKLSSRPLTLKQKAALSMLAKKAFTKAQAFHSHDDLTADQWRHREAVSVVGVTISEATNGMFKALESHFAALAGDVGKAYDSAVRDTQEDDARETFIALIQKALATHSKPMAYADKIAQDKHFPPTERAAAWQLKQVYMTVKSRMAWLTKKKAEVTSDQ